MAKKSFKPQSLRTILFILLTVVIVGGLGLFYLGLSEIRNYAVEVNHTIADAEASKLQVQQLQALKSQLAQSEELIATANQTSATADSYQNQAIVDTRNYANASGLSIAKISFDDIVAGVNPTMTVSLKAPVSYSKLIKFLDGIEGNVPKMQVSNIGLNHVSSGGTDSVVVDDIKITIATR